MKAFFILVGFTIFTIKPTAVVKNSTFSNVEIIYHSYNPGKYIFFKIEAYFGKKWVLIDTNANCKELNTSNIVSCGPTKVKSLSTIKFSLKDCELIYAYDYNKCEQILLRLRAVDYYSGKSTYFPPFLVKK